MVKGKLANKLNKLLNTKLKIRAAIIECGVDMPVNVVFNNYDTYIKKISDVPETSDIMDLMLMCDMFEEIYKGSYKENNYSESEEQEIVNLINLIVEGE